MEGQALLLNRRSVYPRQFDGTSIPKEVLLQAFEAANWAPTHKRTQPWRFIVHSGKAKEDLVNQWVLMAKENLNAKGEEWTDAMEKKYSYFRQASHIIAIAGHYTGMVPEIEETCATAAAVQNFWLSLFNQGYHGYWSTGNGTFTDTMHAYFSLAHEEKLLGYFIAGKAEGTIPPSVRKPVEELITWRD